MARPDTELLGATGESPPAFAESVPEGLSAHSAIWIPLIVIIVLLAVWQFLVSVVRLPPVVLPSPLTVLNDAKIMATTGFQGETLWTDAWVSAARIAAGFVAAIIIGAPLGLWMGTNKYVFRAIDPILQFVRPVPPLAYIPLLVVWFGIGEVSKGMVILLGSIPIIMISALSGVKSTPRHRIQVAQCLGATRFQIFRYVILPSALPEIFTGMRVGIGVAWTCLVAAEMVGASAGLGALVELAGNAIDAGGVLVGIVAIGLLGYFMELVIRAIERIAVPWKGHG